MARWLEGKRLTDNAEGLWRVHDKIYDLSKFMKLHPGGSEWLELTHGCDITEPFEAHHIDNEKVEKILEKYFVRDAAKPRIYKFTYDENGFYRTLKRRVAEKMKTIDKTPMRTSKLISDIVLVLVFVTSIIAIKCQSVALTVLAGIFLHWSVVISHNFFHQKDNWRMYIANLSLISYRDVRVLHALSHHLYTNTYFDLEMSKYEPFLNWLPKKKSRIFSIASAFYSPFIYMAMLPFEFSRG